MSYFNKAWVAALVSFIAMTGATYLHFTISPEIQAMIVALLTGGMTFIVPNKKA